MNNRGKRADLTGLKRFGVSRRATKSAVMNFSKIPGSARSFFNSLPDFLKAKDLLSLAADLNKARSQRKGIIWMFGAHVLKVGLSPIINDLIKNGYITHLALNGACVIHDLEIAFWGRTSEDVDITLADGSFGMVKETPQYLAEALAGVDDAVGIGEAMGAYILKKKPKFAKYSILATAFRANLPVSVHVAIGTDTISQHPEFDAALWGAKSHLDFKTFCASAREINNGGVVINFGSAVILPEVFLKVLTVARNLYGRVADFSAANFDMIQHYRPNENVVRRPTLEGGKRYSFTGHHEIMLPLLAAAIKSSK
jgi:hypothetical protein